MANLLRDAFVSELQSRGWSRFTAAELQLYLDWGLRDVVGEAKWEGSRKTATVANDQPSVAFSAIDAGGVRQINKVYITTADNEGRLKPMGDEEFFDWLALDPTENEGIPTEYYVYQDAVYFKPAPDKSYDFKFHYIEDLASFGGNNASGLPERFDEAILCAAESYCFRRAHEVERMAVAQSEMRRIVLRELVRDGQAMEERDRRVIPHR